MGLLIWLSGADKSILAQCEKLGHSEHTKYAGIGALVLVPPLLGWASMTYAVSTIARDKPLIYLGAGLLWFFVVLSIDRFLVSTVHKSELPHSRLSQVVPIVGRLIFAIFVGIAVSHPLILLWFDETISAELATQQRETASQIDQRTDAQLEQLERPTELDSQLADAQELSRCLLELQTAEQSGRVVRLPCGFSSGLAECERRCEVIADQQELADQRVAELEQAVAGEDQDQAQQAAGIERRAESQKEQRRDDFSRDYLARVDTLAEIESENPEITVVSRFMLIFFVLVDLLPMVLKLTTPIGEYERIRDTRLLEATLRQTAEREVVKGSELSEALLESRIRNRVYRESANDLSGLAADTIRLYERRRREFDEEARAAQRAANYRTGTPEHQTLIDQLLGARESFNRAWQTIFDRLRTRMDSP